MKYIAIGLAGAAGAILRYLTGLAGTISGFPAGTFIANMSGCFLLAFLTAGVFKMDQFPKNLAAPIGTGLIGSYTTFSAFSLESVQLFEGNRFDLALLYIAVSGLLGLALAIAGYRAGNVLLERREQR
ncbi:CrcB family protein [Bacillus sp. FJAT-42376]|uniref:fluoride efflux transporter FluC n=1 Tax=Bacillus sp. FJAT-42376 TaxID=2014076 RepID=UPI0013DE36A4|nr:CrcB family protein [Bacillus sp. FJAT-42376]